MEEGERSWTETVKMSGYLSNGAASEESPADPQPLCPGLMADPRLPSCSQPLPGR